MRQVSALARGIASVPLTPLPGLDPGEGSPRYGRLSSPTMGTTPVFVDLTVPGMTPSALVLAAALNRETGAMAELRRLVFLGQVLSIIFSPPRWTELMPTARLRIPGSATRALTASKDRRTGSSEGVPVTDGPARHPPQGAQVAPGGPRKPPVAPGGHR